MKARNLVDDASGATPAARAPDAAPVIQCSAVLVANELHRRALHASAIAFGIIEVVLLSLL